MKKIFPAFSISSIICALFFVSCTQTIPEKATANGFIAGTGFHMKMGNPEAVEVFKKLDAAWSKLD